jgi:REP element-mobilizing transposase RayT
MKKYSSNEMTALVGVSSARLIQYRTGREVKRKGKVEWKEAPILDESDYEQTVENGRVKMYYYDSALEKIRSHQQKD